jgi:hypothetical protein
LPLRAIRHAVSQVVAACAGAGTASAVAKQTVSAATAMAMKRMSRVVDARM